MQHVNTLTRRIIKFGFIMGVFITQFSLVLLILSTPFIYVPVARAEQHKYMGAGSCSSSNCHGGTSPRNSSNVLQNEYVSWTKHDLHSKAWSILTTQDSKKIGKHLGMDAPEREPLCLKCHATYVESKAYQGERYQLEDGVTCESCHGAAEKWLSAHAESDSAHSENVSLGLLDLVPLENRAKLCLSCHYGTDDKTVNHRLIGAGHPRLSFELDTFGMLQTAHWNVDEDYQKRKGGYNSVQAWLSGQAVLSLEILDALVSAKRSHQGIWPEPVLFHCYACHHSLTRDDWKNRDYAGHPGELPLNLSPLFVLADAMKTVNPGLGERIGGPARALLAGYSKGGSEGDIQSLRDTLKKDVLPFTLSYNLKDSHAPQLLKGVLQRIAAESHLQYEEAEQLTMGMSSVLAANDALGKRFKGDLDGMYTTLDDPENFIAEDFKGVAGKFLDNLG